MQILSLSYCYFSLTITTCDHSYTLVLFSKIPELLESQTTFAVKDQWKRIVLRYLLSRLAQWKVICWKIYYEMCWEILWELSCSYMRHGLFIIARLKGVKMIGCQRVANNQSEQPESDVTTSTSLWVVRAWLTSSCWHTVLHVLYLRNILSQCVQVTYKFYLPILVLIVLYKSDDVRLCSQIAVILI